MALDPADAALIAAKINDAEAIRVIGWALCQPNRSKFDVGAAIEPFGGETVTAAADRLRVGWSPRWLFDAGFVTADPSGAPVSETIPASVTGPVSWTPRLRLARLDDQISNSTPPTSTRYDRRLTGEIAVLSLWESARVRSGLPDLRPPGDLDGNTRGAIFRDFLIEVLRRSLPDTWQVRHEVPLTSIRGLHMRRNVGERKSDIVVTDEGNRLVAVISSKWTWRSDRGTEAAQMVPLRNYRPDVPYALVTAEFARVRVIARESVEDTAYHLCPEWAGAWYAATRIQRAGIEYPTLDALRSEGRTVADAMALEGLDDLVGALRSSGTIL